MKNILLSILLFITFNSNSQTLKLDSSKYDTLTILTGVSHRLHDTLNTFRTTNLNWDSLPGEYYDYSLYDFNADNLILEYLDDNIHIIQKKYTEYCGECEDKLYNIIQNDRYIQRMLNKKGNGQMFTSFMKYNNDYIFIIITKINNKEDIYMLYFNYL
jgi:hypothetical protein